MLLQAQLLQFGLQSKFCSMKKITLFYLLSFCAIISAQEEIRPLTVNSNIYKEKKQLKSNNNIDSSFVYNIDTLDLPVWDDFSLNKFIPYNSDFSDGNVTSIWYYQLMNSTNTMPQPANSIFCDSTHAHHDTVSVVSGIPTTTTDYFSTGVSVWVNDLSFHPVVGQMRTLFQECYVLVDSIIDGVPDPDQDTIWYTILPDFVQDSAHVFFVDYSDPNTIWADNFAYHNYTFAVNPWSLGVATFDGVDENGWPYDFGNESAHELADVLTSRPINLAGKTSVFLTFIYQQEGYGNAPETNDSLLLDWWLPDSNAWYPSGLSVPGGGTTDSWDTVHWAVPTQALDNGFRFRFRNYATTSGALDHWHIDYVLLEDNALPTPSNFSDLAVSMPINTFLKTYTSVPWDHFKNLSDVNAVMLDTLKVKVYNSDLTPTNYANGSMSVSYNAILQGGSPYTLANPAITSEWTGNWELGLNQYPYPLKSNYTYDNAVNTLPQAAFDIKLNIDAAVSASNIYDVNDTTYFVQDFRNYYAYDDGSAEAAYGITGSHSLLAYKFEAYEADTLTGILIHFVPSVYDHSDEQFLLTIWDDNNGQPGNIIYQDDYFNTHSPVYSGSVNGFKYYTFMNNQTVSVPEVFYVGWDQIGTVSLNVGLDLTVDNGDKIYRNTNGSWLTSSFDASLMIRPVFSTAMNYTLSVLPNNPLTDFTVQLFPNPTQNFVQINTSSENYSVMVFDLTGRQIINAENILEIDLSEFENGIYLVRVIDKQTQHTFTEKIVKN